jgi:hypothetical protein
MPWRVTIDVDLSEKLDAISSLLKNAGYTKIVAHQFDAQQTQTKPTPKEPTPIVTQDRNPSSQLERMAKYCKEQHPRVVYPDDMKKWLVSQGWSAASISQMALLRPFGITSNGKGRGYSWRPSGH